MGQGRCQLCPCAPAREPPRLPLDPASRLGLLTGAAGRMGQAQRPRPFRLWELGLPGRFLGTSSLWHSVCAFNVQGGAEHGHFDAAAVFRAAPAATFPIVAAAAAAESRCRSTWLASSTGDGWSCSKPEVCRMCVRVD